MKKPGNNRETREITRKLTVAGTRACLLSLKGDHQIGDAFLPWINSTKRYVILSRDRDLGGAPTSSRGRGTEHVTEVGEVLRFRSG